MPLATSSAGLDARAVSVSPRRSQEPALWREAMAAYAKPRRLRSIGDVFTSVVTYLALCGGIYLVLRASLLIALALAPVAAVFLLRTYIVFHDCSHGSFLASRRGNLCLDHVFAPLAEVFVPLGEKKSRDKQGERDYGLCQTHCRKV